MRRWTRPRAAQPGKVLVVTPMMTRGGEHVEREIPAAVARARRRHPGRTRGVPLALRRG